METKSIMKLADAVYFEYCHALPREGQYGYETCMNALRRIATEQDRIARQDEREKAKNAFCMASCGKREDETCPNTDTSVCECKEYMKFCKAMEGGEG